MSSPSKIPDGSYTCEDCWTEVPWSEFKWINRYTCFGQCPSCGKELSALGDPGPESFPETGDAPDRGIVLNDAGPNLAAVASLIRGATNISVPAALQMARKRNIEILRVGHHRLPDLEDLQRALHSAGARTSIQ